MNWHGRWTEQLVDFGRSSAGHSDETRHVLGMVDAPPQHRQRSWDPEDVSEGVVKVEPLAAPDQLAAIPALSPDPETVQRDPMRIEQAWIERDGHTLWLVGLHGFGQRLHSIAVEERSNSVTITAMSGFDREYLEMMIEEELD